MFSIVSIKNCNHKSLGIYYLYSSLLFGISGTLCSMILRLELYSSGFNYVIQHYIFIHPEIPTPGIMLKIRTPDDIRGVGSIIYTSSNQAIAISKSNNPWRVKIKL